jgi:hypothetical protein
MPIGPKAAGWFKDELERLSAAAAGGASQDELRAITKGLLAERERNKRAVMAALQGTEVAA